MTPKPTLAYNDIIVESNQYRVFAISHLGEKVPHGAVILYTKKDGTYDKCLTKFGAAKFGDARRAIREIPAELLAKLHADTEAWESDRSKLALKSSKPKADAFIEAYKLAQQEFDAKIEALQSEYGITDSCVDYDVDYSTTTLYVTVYDKETKVHTKFGEMLD
jgi:uncharacterized FlaG/YvyC family protein